MSAPDRALLKQSTRQSSARPPTAHSISASLPPLEETRQCLSFAQCLLRFCASALLSNSRPRPRQHAGTHTSFPGPPPSSQPPPTHRNPRSHFRLCTPTLLHNHLSLTHTHSHCFTHARRHTHTPSLSLTVTDTSGPTHTLSLSHTRPRARTHTHTQVAIVGYTNAGKSTLLNKLCGNEEVPPTKRSGHTRPVIGL